MPKSNSLFVYGHSLAENDRHILNRIAHGRVHQLFVSLYDDPNSPDNRQVVARANALAAGRKLSNPLAIQFYSAEDCEIWE